MKLFLKENMPYLYKMLVTIKKSITFLWAFFDWCRFYLFEKPAFMIWAYCNRANAVKLACYQPFTEIEIFPDGGCTLCDPTWLPIRIGNVNNASLKHIFNSIQAQRIRISLYYNRLQYCDKKLCNTLNSKNFKMKAVAELSSDGPLTDQIKQAVLHRRLVMPHGPSEVLDFFSTVCNIFCKFCRSTHVKRAPSPKMEKVMGDYAIANAGMLKRVSFCGGEPLIQNYVLEIIKECYARNPNISYYITTNLVSLRPDVKKLFEVINMNPIHISLNAASDSAYSAVVDGAKWEKVLENFRYIAELRSRRPDSCIIDASMVVTKGNYIDIVPFAELCLQYGVRRIEYYPLLVSHENAYLQLQEKEKMAVQKILSTPLFQTYKERLEIGPLLESVR